MDNQNSKKSLSEVFSNAMKSGMRELDLWDLAQLPRKRRKMTPKTITRYSETMNDFLLGKINEEKCIRRLRVLTGMSAKETDSLLIKLKERQIILRESKLKTNTLRNC